MTTTMNMENLSKYIRKIDFCMMCTRREDGRIATRPMSNNGDVEYDGDSWFFTYDDTSKISEINRDRSVTLTFSEPPSLLGKPGIFISIDGVAEIIRDRSYFAEHWTNGLDHWFPDGIETPGLALLKVSAEVIQYWDGEENGKINLVGS
jgi:general stress protein 26